MLDTSENIKETIAELHEMFEEDCITEEMIDSHESPSLSKNSYPSPIRGGFLFISRI